MKVFGSRITAITLIVSLMLPPVSFAVNDVGTLPLKTADSFNRSSFPARLGTFLEPLPPSAAGPNIYHIQDAHASTDAQYRIADIVRFLIEEHGVRLLLLEGAEGELQGERLHFFTEDNLNRQVARLLTERGEIGGGELYLLDPAAAAKVRAFGVEDSGLYWENVFYYRLITEHQPLIDAYLADMTSALRSAASTTVRPELLEFLMAWLDYQRAPESLPRFSQFLKDKAHKTLRLDFRHAHVQRAWPSLVRFFALQEHDGPAFDSAAFERDRELLGDWVRKQGVSTDAWDSVQSLSDSLKAPGAETETGRPLLRTTLEQFFSDFAGQGFRFENYPHFFRPVALRAIEEELDVSALHDEIENLSRNVMKALASDKEEKDIVRLFEDFRFVRDLYSLTVSREEDKHKIASADALSLSYGPFAYYQRIQDFLRNPPPSDLPVRLSQMERLFSAALKFYQTAMKRDTAMAEKTLQIMKTMGQTKAILVTGGFHGTGLRETLIKNHRAYATILPRITAFGNDRPYSEVMIKTLDLPEADPAQAGLKSPLYVASGAQTHNRISDLMAAADLSGPAAASDFLRKNPEQVRDRETALQLLEIKTQVGQEQTLLRVLDDLIRGSASESDRQRREGAGAELLTDLASNQTHHGLSAVPTAEGRWELSGPAMAEFGLVADLDPAARRPLSFVRRNLVARQETRMGNLTVQSGVIPVALNPRAELRERTEIESTQRRFSALLVESWDWSDPQPQEKIPAFANNKIGETKRGVVHITLLPGFPYQLSFKKYLDADDRDGWEVIIKNGGLQKGQYEIEFELRKADREPIPVNYQVGPIRETLAPRKDKGAHLRLSPIGILAMSDRMAGLALAKIASFTDRDQFFKAVSTMPNLVGLRFAPTDVNGQAAYFPARGEDVSHVISIGFSDAGWVGEIKRVSAHAVFADVEIEFTKEGKEPIRKVVQIGPFLDPRNEQAVLQVSDRMGLQLLKRLVSFPEPEGLDSELAPILYEVQGLQMGYLDDYGRLPFSPDENVSYPLTVYADQSLKLQNPVQVMVESVAVLDGHKDLQLKLTDAKGREVFVDHQIGPFTKTIPQGAKKNQAAPFFLVNPRMGLIPFRALLMDAPDQPWDSIVQGMPPLHGLRFGRLNKDGALEVQAAGGKLRIAMPILGFVIGANGPSRWTPVIYNAFEREQGFDFIIEATSRKRNRSVLQHLRIERDEYMETVDPILDDSGHIVKIRRVKVANLTRRGFENFLIKPKFISWADMIPEFAALRGEVIGVTDRNGHMPLFSNTSHPFSWNVLERSLESQVRDDAYVRKLLGTTKGDSKEGWLVVLRDMELTDWGPVVHTELVNGESVLFKRFLIGPEKIEVSHRNRQTNRKILRYGLNNFDAFLSEEGRSRFKQSDGWKRSDDGSMDMTDFRSGLTPLGKLERLELFDELQSTLDTMDDQARDIARAIIDPGRSRQQWSDEEVRNVRRHLQNRLRHLLLDEALEERAFSVVEAAPTLSSGAHSETRGAPQSFTNANGLEFSLASSVDEYRQSLGLVVDDYRDMQNPGQVLTRIFDASDFFDLSSNVVFVAKKDGKAVMTMSLVFQRSPLDILRTGAADYGDAGYRQWILEHGEEGVMEFSMFASSLGQTDGRDVSVGLIQLLALEYLYWSKMPDRSAEGYKMGTRPRYWIITVHPKHARHYGILGFRPLLPGEKAYGSFAEGVDKGKWLYHGQWPAVTLVVDMEAQNERGDLQNRERFDRRTPFLFNAATVDVHRVVQSWVEGRENNLSSDERNQLDAFVDELIRTLQGDSEQPSSQTRGSHLRHRTITGPSLGIGRQENRSAMADAVVTVARLLNGILPMPSFFSDSALAAEVELRWNAPAVNSVLSAVQSHLSDKQKQILGPGAHAPRHQAFGISIAPAPASLSREDMHGLELALASEPRKIHIAVVAGKSDEEITALNDYSQTQLSGRLFVLGMKEAGYQETLLGFFEGRRRDFPVINALAGKVPELARQAGIETDVRWSDLPEFVTVVGTGEELLGGRAELSGLSLAQWRLIQQPSHESVSVQSLAEAIIGIRTSGNRPDEVDPNTLLNLQLHDKNVKRETYLADLRPQSAFLRAVSELFEIIRQVSASA